MIDGLNFSNYRRFFAFGCSFTRYWWPTWADLIAQEIPESYNYGLCGAGNHYIFNSVIYAHQKFKFNQDDLIIIMWTNVMREDRYIRGSWLVPGNIYTQNTYDENFMKYVDPRGFLIRDLAYMSAIDTVLASSGCHYDHLSILPVLNIENFDFDITGDLDLTCNFQNLLVKFKPSMHTTMYKSDWTKSLNLIPNVKTKLPYQKQISIDYHPHTQTHFDYLEKIYGHLKWSVKTLDYLDHINKQLEELVEDNIGGTTSPTHSAIPLLGNT
jgi:hypothetical protein